MSRTFLYFAYGSNLLTKRIHINNPTAVKRDIGKLKNFRLDFVTYSKRWKGASATIVPTADNSHHVWGVVWEIANENLPDLDNQEGVSDKIYFPINVEIENPRGDVMQCRVYQQCNNPKEFVPIKNLPDERKPSAVYLKTIVKGASENELPKEYIDFLKTIPHNGYTGEVDVGERRCSKCVNCRAS